MNADYQDFKYKEQTIIKVFYRVYNKLGYGFLEKIYENAHKSRFTSGISSEFAERLTAEVVTPRNRATSAPEYPISFTAS